MVEGREERKMVNSGVMGRALYQGVFFLPFSRRKCDSLYAIAYIFADNIYKSGTNMFFSLVHFNPHPHTLGKYRIIES